MQHVQSPVKLAPAERRALRRALGRRFDLAALKDLAFDLGAEYSVYHQTSRRAFCRELVAGYERLNRVRCLVEAVLERAPEEEDELRELAARLPACAPWVRLQVTPDEATGDVERLLASLAAELDIGPDGIGRDSIPRDGIPRRIVLVSAVRGGVRMLVSAHAEAAERAAGAGLVPFEALEALERHAWRWVTHTWPPTVAGGVLQPVASWEEALDAVRANLMREGIQAVEEGLSSARAGQSARANESLQRAIEIARELGDAEMEAAVLGHLGNARYAAGQVEQAIERYRQALDVAREITRETGDRRAEGIHLGNLGVAYSALGQPQAAIAYYQRALAIAREAGDLRIEGNLLGNLGLAYSALTLTAQSPASAHSTAVDYYQQALAIAREVSYQVGDRRAEGTLLCYLGDAYRGVGRAPSGGGAALRRANLYTAADTYHRALVLARAAGDARVEGDLLGRLGNTYLSLGDLGDGHYRTAIDHYQRALYIAREIGDRKGEGVRLANLGSAYYALGQFEQALATYEQALAIAREIGDRCGEGMRLGNLGNAYYALAVGDPDGRACDLGPAPIEPGLPGQAPEFGEAPGSGATASVDGADPLHAAIDAYRQALAIAREVGDRGAEGAHLSHLGLATCALGDLESYAAPPVDGPDDEEPPSEARYRAAIEAFEQALVIAREFGDRKAEGLNLGCLGDAFSSLGRAPGARPRARRPAAARECYRQALAIAREIGDRRAEAHHLGHLGGVYNDLGEQEQAIAALEQALIIAREIGDRTAEASHLGNLGLAYSAFGQDGRARTYFQQAVSVAHELGDRRCEGNWLGNLGGTYGATGQFEQAVRCYSRALEIAREFGDRQSEATWLGNLGNAYVALREVQQGMAAYEEALAIAREVGDRQEEEGLLGNLGNAYSAQHRWEQASTAYQEALAVAREIGDRRGEGIWLLNLGLALDEQGDREGAIAQVTAARDALEAARSPEAAQALEALEQWEEKE